MRLLVVGHTYITAINQAKYVAMKRLDPYLQLRLLVPQESKDMYVTHKPEKHPGLGSQEVVVLPSVFNQSLMMRVLHPARLAAFLKTFEPQHIHIEEDPHSFAGVETVFFSRRVCRRATISFFIWDNLARVPRFPLSVIKTVLARYSFDRCALVVCGNTEAQHLLRAIKGFTGPSMVLPQFGLDPDESDTPLPPELPRLLGKCSATPLIGFLGRLVPEKGVLLLLEALSRLRALRWKLLVVGNGPLKSELRTRWKDELGDRLMVLDGVPRSVYRQYLRCLDILVVPSYAIPTWKEQFGYNIAEAMMAGVACVGSSSGAIPEVIGPGGLTFKERDVAELTYTLEKILQSETLRKELGEKGRVFALERYTNARIAGDYLAAFKQVVAINTAKVV